MPEPKKQIDKFKEAARELGTDESEEHFDRVLKRVVKAQPKDDKPKAKRKVRDR